MERRGGCCIARCGDASMAWQMGRIMLRFRPIAPKPAAMAPAPAATPTLVADGGRGKRKAASANGAKRGGKRGRRPKKAPTTATAKASDDKEKSSSLPSSSSSGMTSVDSSSPATLSLLPESPEAKKEASEVPKLPSPPQPAPATPQVVVPRPLRPAASWVTVEGLTDTWRDGEAGPSVPMPTSACHVAGDEAPAFVSDQWGRVTWTNAAFNRVVTGCEEAVEVRVGLVTKGTMPAWGTCAGFTCRVRVRYACPRRGRGSLAAPCDVWRLDSGAYIWRVDIQAALSLGLGLGVSLTP